MSLRELSKYIFSSKYARYLPEKKRRETWKEAISRVEKMHLEKYPEIEEEIKWAFQFVYDKKVSGSQRALQFGGKAILDKNARNYNCCSAYCDRLRFFQEAFYCLLCGTGVGYSVQKHHIAKLPTLLDRANPKNKTYIIPDTIEGWSDSIGVLLSSYFNNPVFPEYQNCNVEFDVSQIRKKGAYLSSSSGKAPGPEPLLECLKEIKELLDRCIADNQSRLRPIDAHDIIMHIADATLSGGVRRSSCIALFSKDDEEMMACKTGNWGYENPQRARANNSVVLLRNKTSYEEFKNLLEFTKTWGDPGFLWVDNLECLTNPCGEISLYGYYNGQSGFQFCNLSSINGKKVKSKEDFLNAAKAAAIIGTIQAGYTDFGYLGNITEEITRKESLLGVSITGFQDNPDILLNPDNQKAAVDVIRIANKDIAKKININVAARLTATKPEGSNSLVMESAAGIHPHHARRYFRNVQANGTENLARFFQLKNPLAVQKSYHKDGDYVLTFCVNVEKGAITKNDLSAIELLKQVKSTQMNWVTYGKNPENCVQPWLNHNVSNTINVREHEWDEVAEYIYDNRDYFCGVALFPHDCDRDFRQAPNVAVLTANEILKEYGEGSLFASGLIVEGLELFDGDLWGATDAALGLNPIEITTDMETWINKVKKFAVRYLDNNLKKTTYLLKDVYNAKRWQDLTREYNEVDYTECIEDEDNTKLEQEIACSGGACTLI